MKTQNRLEQELILKKRETLFISYLIQMKTQNRLEQELILKKKRVIRWGKSGIVPSMNNIIGYTYAEREVIIDENFY